MAKGVAYFLSALIVGLTFMARRGSTPSPAASETSGGKTCLLLSCSTSTQVPLWKQGSGADAKQRLNSGIVKGYGRTPVTQASD